MMSAMSGTMTGAWLLLAALLTAGAADIDAVPPAEIENMAACNKDVEGYCGKGTASYDLVSSQKRIQIALNIGTSVVTSIYLPEGIELGPDDVVIGNPRVFTHRLQGTRITVWPTLPENAEQIAKTRNLARVEEVILGAQGNLQLTMRGWSVNIDLRVMFADESTASLTFTSRELAAEENKIEQRIAAGVAKCEAEKKELEGTTDEAAQEKGKELLAHAVLSELKCSDITETQMREMIWVQADRVCRIGSETHIRFRIRNRSAKAFTLETVEVRGDGPLDARAYFQRADGTPVAVDAVTLGRNEELRGAVVFPTALWNGPVRLKVTETGERGRAVELEDINL
jgi:hypothetical protein